MSKNPGIILLSDIAQIALFTLDRSLKYVHYWMSTMHKHNPHISQIISLLLILLIKTGQLDLVKTNIKT